MTLSQLLSKHYDMPCARMFELKNSSPYRRTRHVPTNSSQTKRLQPLLEQVSVGGNDAKDELPGCQIAGGSADDCVAKVIADVTANTRTFLDPVVEAYPNVKIFQFGYDILNFGENLECIAMGTALFPSCHDNAECVNTQFVKIQHDYVEKLSQNYTQHTALNILGTLQHAGNDPQATPGNPDLAKWSPKDLMEDNCIHASQDGFQIIFEQVYSMYLEGNTTFAKKESKQ